MEINPIMIKFFKFRQLLKFSFSTSAISSVNDAHISGNKLFIASYGMMFIHLTMEVSLFFLTSINKMLNLQLSLL